MHSTSLNSLNKTTEHKPKPAAGNKFPVDIFAVKEYGVDKWQSEFFWPFSDHEFNNLCQDIEQCFTAEINNHPEEIKVLAGIQYKLKVEYANFLHALKRIQQMQSQGKEILYSDKAWWYKNLMEEAPVDIRVSTLGAMRRNFFGDLKNKARVLIKSLVFNKSILKHFNQLGKKETVQLLGPVKPIAEQYIAKIPQWVNFITQWDWLPRNIVYEVPSELKERIEEFSKSMTDGLNSIAKRYEIRLSEDNIEHLKGLTASELINAAGVLHLVRSKLKKYRKKVHLLTSTGASFFQRVLSIAIREYGGKVTVFAHGGDVGFINTPIGMMPFFDIPFADEFVTYTDESALLYKKINNNYSHCPEHKLQIISGETDEFFKLWKKYGNSVLPEKNKRVMLIGYPQTQWRRPFENGGDAFTNLDLELRLIEFLKKAGYEVLYKAHPDRIAEVEGIFEDKTQLLKGYFEPHIDKADVFLFPNITTTAFAIALCTNKPIIAFDISFSLFEPFPEAMELCHKRCSVVNNAYDERNRITFDEKQLLDALSRKVEQPNTEFIEKYMFPTSYKKGR
jgi:hypothetical protein